jgi:hypothetical protein
MYGRDGGWKVDGREDGDEGEMGWARCPKGAAGRKGEREAAMAS